MTSQSFYRHHVFVCLNQRPEGHATGCCASKQAETVFNYLKARVKELDIEGVRVNRAGCMDRCGSGPVVVIYPQAVWYRVEDIAAAEQMVQQHLIGGGLAKDRMI